MWRLSGIERDIYLYSTPKQYIADYQVTSTLDKETYTDGLFALETTIGGEAEGAATLSYRLEDACGKTILEKGLSGSKQGKRQFHFFFEKETLPKVKRLECGTSLSLYIDYFSKRYFRRNHTSDRVQRRVSYLGNQRWTILHKRCAHIGKRGKSS